MKSKLLLPLVAIVFALASAFASTPLTEQTAWFHVPPSGSQSGEIDTPADASMTNPCTVSQTIACEIDSNVAYESPEGAAAQDPDLVLRYDE